MKYFLKFKYLRFKRLRFLNKLFTDFLTRKYKSLPSWKVRIMYIIICTTAVKPFFTNPVLCLKRGRIEVWRRVPCKWLALRCRVHGRMAHCKRRWLDMTGVSHRVVEVIFRPVVDRMGRIQITLSSNSVLHFGGELSLPFCTTVLEPYLDLRFCEFERFWKFHSSCYA